MRKHRLAWIVMGLIAILLAGCSGDPQTSETPDATETETATVPDETSAPAQESTQDPEEEHEHEEDASSYYINEVYAEQIARYYTALSEQWDEGKYLENNMSALASYYYEGNPLDNVGFGFADLDNDGSCELIIGAIQAAEQDPAVFEIWTVSDGEPVMLAQGGSRNRFYLQYAEEDRAWYVANEAENGAANSAVYYLMLYEGELKVVQAIIFDAIADEENPWFMAYDTDWDTSNDTPTDEATAIAVMEANRNIYVAIEYFPYTLYK